MGATPAVLPPPCCVAGGAAAGWRGIGKGVYEPGAAPAAVRPGMELLSAMPISSSGLSVVETAIPAEAGQNDGRNRFRKQPANQLFHDIRLNTNFAVSQVEAVRPTAEDFCKRNPDAISSP